MGVIRSSHLLGIDIRQNFIRLVELSYRDSKYRVEACINLELAESGRSDKAVISAIKSILQQISPKTEEVAIALSHTVAVFKELQVTAGLSSKEIREILRFNFIEQLGETKGSFDFDYQVTEEVVTTDNLVKLQAVAVRHTCVEKWVKLLRVAKLFPKIIDVDIYALERAIRLQLGNIDDLTAVVNIDYGQVLIIVLDNKKILYVHEDIFDQENLISINQVLELFDAKLRLLDSILPQPLTKLILGGERVTLPGLITAIDARFNLQAMLANPFLGMELSAAISQEDLLQLSPLMLISCGLALRAKDDDKN